MPATLSKRAAQRTADTIANDRALSRKHRDALYVVVIKSLQEVGALPGYIERSEFHRAYALRKRMEDQLALLDYLHWDPRPPGRGRPFPIPMAPWRLQKTLMLLRSHSVTQITSSQQIAVQKVYAELEDQINERERALCA